MERFKKTVSRKEFMELKMTVQNLAKQVQELLGKGEDDKPKRGRPVKNVQDQ